MVLARMSQAAISSRLFIAMLVVLVEYVGVVSNMLPNGAVIIVRENDDFKRPSYQLAVHFGTFAFTFGLTMAIIQPRFRPIAIP